MTSLGAAPLMMITAASGGLVLILIGVTALLSLLRLRRESRLNALIRSIPQPAPPPAEPEATLIAPLPPAFQRPQLRGKIIEPESPVIPSQPVAPDQVVIQINAPEGPSQAQINVQRLIDYLKREAVVESADVKAS